MQFNQVGSQVRIHPSLVLIFIAIGFKLLRIANASHGVASFQKEEVLTVKYCSKGAVNVRCK